MPLPRYAALSLALSACLVARISSADSATSPLVSSNPDTLQEGRTQDLDQARTHFQQAVQFYNAGDYFHEKLFLKIAPATGPVEP